MITDKAHIASLVERCVYQAHKAGLIECDGSDALTMDRLYDFSLDDILGVYTYQYHVGDGIWFLLKNGTICNHVGVVETETCFLDYDSGVFCGVNTIRR